MNFPTIFPNTEELPGQFKYHVPAQVFKRSVAKSFYTLNAATKYVRDITPAEHITKYWKDDWSEYLRWIIQEIKP